jgi:Tol biopolymer transport system component
MDRQTQVLELLSAIVRGTEDFQRAQEADRLIKLPTGDGMALVFFDDPIAPVRCACEISHVLREDPKFNLRMGVHTGPVYRIADINTESNVAGGGINVAQRVMDCGDAGHILVSNTVAEVLAQLSNWADTLHDLGPVEVKHGIKIHLHNLFTNDVGNAKIPERAQRKEEKPFPERLLNALRLNVHWVALGSIVVLLLTTAVTYWAVQAFRSARSTQPSQRIQFRLTFDPGLQIQPAWSPDGHFVAYSSDKRGNFDIYVQQVGSDKPILITEEIEADDWQPDWSPNQNEIVFRSERDGGGLYVVPAFGGRIRKISSFGYMPHWSPDGSKVLFVSSSLRITELPKVYVVTLDGTAPQQILANTLQQFRAVWSVVWHPDGQRISFLGRTGESGWDFWTVDLQTGSIVRSETGTVKQAVSNIAVFRWSSPDVLYFEGTSRFGLTNLWKVEVEPKTLSWKGVPQPLTSGLQDTDLALSSDGLKIAYTMRTEENRIWELPYDSVSGQIKGPGQPITPPDLEALFPDLTLDGKTLAFIAFRNGVARQELMQLSLGEKQPRSLEFDDFRRVAPRWSRDGLRLAYRRSRFNSDNSRTEYSIVLLPKGGGDEQILTSPSHPSFDLVYDWSLDGSWIVGGSNRTTKRVSIVKFPLSAAPHAETEMKQIASDDNYDLWQGRLSPNGRWICFNAVDVNETGKSIIYVISIDGGQWFQITDNSVWSDKPRWSFDGNILYYVSNRQTPFFNIWGIKINPNQGTAVGNPFQITNFNGPRRMLSSLLASIDYGITKDQLVLPIQEVSGNIWILETKPEG